VIFEGKRRAEERHDAVAHDLVDGALVAMDGLDHPLEDRVQELPGLLRVPISQQLHRALEVGEEHGNLLALTLKRAPRRQDLLGEVFGRVGLGGGEAARRGRLRRSGRKRRPATIAELASGLHLGAAAGTDDPKRRAALSAESCPVAVLCLAPGTLHRGRPPDWGSRASFLREMSAPSLLIIA